MATVEYRPKTFAQKEIEGELLSRQKTIERWQDPYNLLELISPIQENGEEHVRRFLQVGESLLDSFPAITNEVNIAIFRGIGLVHDLGEYRNGDTLGTVKEGFPKGKLDELRKDERASLVKTVKETKLPEFVVQLYDEYENWQNEERLTYPTEAAFSQFVDKFINERIYSIHQYRIGSRPTKEKVENDLRKRTYARRVFHRLRVLHERMPQKLEVLILTANVIDWMAGDYKGQEKIAAEELLRASTFDFPEYARFLGRSRGYHPRTVEDPLKEYYQPSLFLSPDGEDGAHHY